MVTLRSVDAHPVCSVSNVHDNTVPFTAVLPTLLLQQFVLFLQCGYSLGEAAVVRYVSWWRHLPVLAADLLLLPD